MYCKKCGKEMRREDYFCPTCGAENFTTVYDAPRADAGNTYGSYADNTAQRATYAYNYRSEEEREADRKRGIGGAIVSVIMAGATMFVLMILLMTMATENLVLMGVFLLLSLATGIVGLVFGLKSIFTFRTMVREGRAKPVPTLVMGIIGTAIGAETVFGILLGALEAFTMIG